MKYPNNPELIASVESINADADVIYLGDKIVGIQVRQDDSNKDGMVDIDVRAFDKRGALVIRIPLPELMAALSCATLHAERSA